jgi:diacylglycerol kinase
MIEFMNKRVEAIGYAFEGWGYVLRTQRNAWIHSLASATAFGLAWWLELNRAEWAILFLTVALVWMSEFINTALEAVVDLTSPEQHPLAKIGKDVGAAAVLVGAMCAVVVGFLIFLPPLMEKFQ